jgi:hypothetical protein
MSAGTRAVWARSPVVRAIVLLLVQAAVTVAGGRAAADDLAAQRAAAHQLVRGQLPSGLLDYDMDFLAGTGFGSGKNRREKAAFIARQASAAYGLAKYFEQTKDDHVREPLARLIAALGDLSLPIAKSAKQRLVESTGLLALPVFRARLRDMLGDYGLLYSRSGEGAVVAYEQGYGTAWAGTTAMALMAELHYFRASGDPRFAALRGRWRRGLDALRLPGHGFREFPDSLDEGSYANGEAWLALALFVDTLPGGAVSADEMRSIDDYMIATYSGKDDVAFFHWGAMATARRFLTSKDGKFVGFAEVQAQAALGSAPPQDTPHNTCPLVEGLAASAATLAQGGRRDSALHRALRTRIRAEMDKNNALQIRPGADRLGAGENGYLFAPQLGDYAGAYLFGRHTPTVRVDMTHHCISAIAEMQ